MKSIQKLVCLIFCLIFTNSFSQTNKIVATPGDGNPFMGVARERMQFVYSRTELLAMGFTAGSIIDTICFNITTRNSTLPYNISISYYYTLPSHCYSALVLSPVVIAGSSVFSGIVNMSIAGNYYVPPSGGYLKIPLNPAIVWNGVSNSLVMEMCLETNSGQAGDSLCMLPTTGCNSVLKVISTQSSLAACSMMPGQSSVLTFASDKRPDIFFCSCQTTPTNFPTEKNNLLKIENIFYTENLLKVKFYSSNNAKFNLRIMEVTGRIVFENNEMNSVAGENTVNINTGLNKGVYFIELKSKDGLATKVFCN